MAAIIKLDKIKELSIENLIIEQEIIRAIHQKSQGKDHVIRRKEKVFIKMIIHLVIVR